MLPLKKVRDWSWSLLPPLPLMKWKCSSGLPYAHCVKCGVPQGLLCCSRLWSCNWQICRYVKFVKLRETALCFMLVEHHWRSRYPALAAASRIHCLHSHEGVLFSSVLMTAEKDELFPEKFGGGWKSGQKIDNGSNFLSYHPKRALFSPSLQFHQLLVLFVFV